MGSDNPSYMKIFILYVLVVVKVGHNKDKCLEIQTPISSFVLPINSNSLVPPISNQLFSSTLPSVQPDGLNPISNYYRSA